MQFLGFIGRAILMIIVFLLGSLFVLFVSGWNLGPIELIVIAAMGFFTIKPILDNR